MHVVLIVDDEVNVREVLLEILAAPNRRLLTAASANEANNIIRSESHIDLALLDKNLPDGNGIDIGRLVRVRFPRSALILMTGYSSTESAVEAMRIGALDYLAKPFDNIGEVEMRVKNALDRVRLELQLEQAMKMDALGRVAAGVAHDFKNLLSVITSCADHLSFTHTEPGADKECVDDIMEASNRGTALVLKLMTMGRRPQTAPRPRPVGELLHDVLPLVQRSVGNAIRVELDLGTTALVAIDPGELSQVMINLAVNADDAMPDGGTLRISTGTEMGGDRCHVVIRVSDSGVGMDQGTCDRIFEPFFTTKGSGGGTGLGLATTFTLLQRAHATIEAESEPGQGTTFVIRLPEREAVRAVS